MTEGSRTNKIGMILARFSRLDWFLVFSLATTGIFFIMNYVCKGDPFYATMLDSQFQFSDYYYHLAGSSQTSGMYAEGGWALFPPLAYCMYYLLWQLNPLSMDHAMLNWEQYRAYDNTLTVLVIYTILLIVLLIYCILQHFPRTEAKYVILLPTAIILSYPMMCTTLQRGNSALLVAILVALSFLWMDSDSKVKQELALIAIAIAAGFKFYPAILGLEYVRRKDIGKVVRLIIYGAVFMFLPFVFFGGLTGLTDMVNNLTAYSEVGYEARFYTINGAVEYILHVQFGVPEAATLLPGKIVQYAFLVISILMFFLSNAKWQRALYLSGIMASFLSSGWPYTCVYYLPVLLCFLYEAYERSEQNVPSEQSTAIIHSKRMDLWNLLNTFLLAWIFSIPFVWYPLHLPPYVGVYFITYVLLVVNMVHTVVCFVKSRKAKLLECEYEIQ